MWFGDTPATSVPNHLKPLGLGAWHRISAVPIRSGGSRELACPHFPLTDLNGAKLESSTRLEALQSSLLKAGGEKIGTVTNFVTGALRAASRKFVTVPIF
jgi:hypothetical protein